MLKGTEKQVAWAEDIIAEARRTVQNNLNNIKKQREELGAGFEQFRQDEVEAFEKCGESLETMLAGIGSASKIIDMRSSLSSGNILHMVQEYCYVMNNKRSKNLK